jgi:hypothetical protein
MARDQSANGTMASSIEGSCEYIENSVAESRQGVDLQLRGYVCIYYVYVVYVFMYVCVNVCIYVCMCQCMYLCMYVCMYVCIYVCVFVYVCVYVYMYVCMYVCVCIYVCKMYVCTM